VRDPVKYARGIFVVTSESSLERGNVHGGSHWQMALIRVRHDKFLSSTVGAETNFAVDVREIGHRAESRQRRLPPD